MIRIREQFLKTIHKFRMLQKGDTALVAVSGGVDSVVLLHLLSEVRTSWKLRLGLVHVNHQLRGRESDRDEVFVRKLAEQFKLPVFTARVDVTKRAGKKKISIEEAAREARYEFFEKTAKKQRAGKIVLAHTQDDQAETVLMRIIGGTGLQGLQAIRPKRKLNGAFLVRPLIEIPKNQIHKFAKTHHIPFREDRSNRSVEFLRNKIRLKLIPFIEKSFNPQVKKALARLPHLLDVDLSFLEETADSVYKKLVRRKHSGEIFFPRQAFRRLKPAIQYRLLNRAMRELAETELNFEHWNSFWERFDAEERFLLQFPKGLFVSVERGAVRIHRKKKLFKPFSYRLSAGKSIYVPETGSTISCEILPKRLRSVRKIDKSFDIFDADKLAFPLTVRNRKPGDRFQPLGQKTSSKLKKLLITKRVPLGERDRLPIVLSNGEIAWVGNVAIGEKFKVKSDTKKLVKISIVLGKKLNQRGSDPGNNGVRPLLVC